MGNDYKQLQYLYEGFRGQAADFPRSANGMRQATLDIKHSYMPHGVSDPGGADNAYAANSFNSIAIGEEEESTTSDNVYEKLVKQIFEKYQLEFELKGNKSAAHNILLLQREVIDALQPLFNNTSDDDIDDVADCSRVEWEKIFR